MAVSIDHQRMDVDPATSCRHELDPVRPPVGFDGVANPVKGSEHLGFVPAVDVDVDISMRTGLTACQHVDPPSPSSQNRQPTERTAATTSSTSSRRIPPKWLTTP